MEKKNMDSLVDVLASVEKMGFTSQFEVVGDRLKSVQTKNGFAPEQVQIIHFYRFEGESNPDDSSILYAIATDTGEQGTLVDGYGTTADMATGLFIQKVSEIHK